MRRVLFLALAMAGALSVHNAYSQAGSWQRARPGHGGGRHGGGHGPSHASVHERAWCANVVLPQVRSFHMQPDAQGVATTAVHADIVLVVGSQNSSNSQRLRELAGEMGKSAHLIDGPGDIDATWLSDAETVLITAGASAPETPAP